MERTYELGCAGEGGSSVSKFITHYNPSSVFGLVPVDCVSSTILAATAAAAESGRTGGCAGGPFMSTSPYPVLVVVSAGLVYSLQVCIKLRNQPKCQLICWDSVYFLGFFWGGGGFER